MSLIVKHPVMVWYVMLEMNIHGFTRSSEKTSKSLLSTQFKANEKQQHETCGKNESGYVNLIIYTQQVQIVQTREFFFICRE